MPLIYNRILTHFSGLNCVALNATGDLAAVCFNDRELHVYRIIEGPRKIDPSQIVNPNIGSLEERASLAWIPIRGDSPKSPPPGRVALVGC